MDITTKITDSNIEESRFIQSNTYSDYYFIAGNVSASLTIDNKTYRVEFQTGHTYDHNDYSMPSNSLSIYEDGSSNLIANIDYHFDELEDKDVVANINCDAETSYTSEQMQAIYQALTELRVDAQEIITEAEREAEERCEEDTAHYVLVRPRELEQINEHEWHKIQCGYDELETFSTEEEADLFIEEKSNNENDIDLTQHLTAEDARGRFPEHF